MGYGIPSGERAIGPGPSEGRIVDSDRNGDDAGD
jgi:hypothetical protein